MHKLFSSRVAVNLFFFVNGFIYASWAARIPRLQDNYHMDNQALGFVLLSFSIGAFIAMPISGWLIVLKGSRHITRISALLSCVFFVLIPYSPNLFIIHILFFSMGASAGIMDVSMNAQAVAVENHLARPIMSFFHAMFSIGMVSGGLAGSIFTKLSWSLHTHFFIAGVSGMVLLLLASLSLYNDDVGVNANKQKIIQWPSRAIVGLGFIAFCCMVGEGSMADWSANYLKHELFANEARAALGLTSFAATMTIGRLLGDRGRSRFGDRKLIQYCAVFALIGIALILSKLEIIVVLIGFGIVGLGLSIIVPIVYSLAGSMPNVPAGVGIGMSTTIGYAGFMVGPPVIGFLADSFSLRFALSFVALLFLIMFVLTLTVKIQK